MLATRPATDTIAQEPAWKTLFNMPVVKVALGLLIGLGLLYLVTRFVDVPTTLHVLRQHLATPRGIILGLLSGMAFLTAFSIRGIRWKLFLNPIGKVSTLKAIQLFLVGIFLNFLLPVRGGEVAKCLMLKRSAGIPRQSIAAHRGHGQGLRPDACPLHYGGSAIPRSQNGHDPLVSVRGRRGITHWPDLFCWPGGLETYSRGCSPTKDDGHAAQGNRGQD